MKHNNDCPVCGNRQEWANNIHPIGIALHSGILERRDVFAKENPGSWLIEIVSIGRGEPFAHATRWGGDYCFTWGLDEVRLLDSDIDLQTINDCYEMDA